MSHSIEQDQLLSELDGLVREQNSWLRSVEFMRCARLEGSRHWFEAGRDLMEKGQAMIRQSIERAEG